MHAHGPPSSSRASAASRGICTFASCATFLLSACSRHVSRPVTTPAPVPSTDAEWRSYGHDAGGMRFSSLAQIDRSNVARLTRAWTYHTGELDARADSATARDA